jgi:hypothetical protein
MLHLRDLTSTLLLILGLGLVLVLLNGRMRWVLEGFESEAIPCGVDTPCDVGLKCINGFCAQTERLRMYDKDEVEEEAQNDPSGPMPLY